MRFSLTGFRHRVTFVPTEIRFLFPGSVEQSIWRIGSLVLLSYLYICLFYCDFDPYLGSDYFLKGLAR